MPDGAIQEMTQALEELRGAADKFQEIRKLEQRLENVESRMNRPRGGFADHNRTRAGGSASGVDDGREAIEIRDQFRRVMTGELEQRALSGSSNANGGYAVPLEIDQLLDAQLRDNSPIRQIAQVVRTTSSDYRKIISDTGTASGWTDEDTERTVTATPTMHSIEPPSGGLYAVPQVSNWLLSDSSFVLENFLRDEVAREFAFQEGAAFVSGNGTNKPKGFLSETLSTADDTSRSFGQLQNTVVASATNITADELIDFYQLLRPAYRANASWVMSSSTATAIRKLKDADSRYLWQSGLQAGHPDVLLGHPVLLSEDMPDLATGQNPIALGDFQRGYLITDRSETTMIRDEITLKGHTKFHFEKRVGGKILDSNAIKILTMA